MSSGHSGQPVAPFGLSELAEHPLEGRHRLAFTWIPDGCERLLDAGCAWGYATHEFATRSDTAAGIDPDRKAIAVAQHRYPEIEFSQGTLEQLPYADASFDVVTCCDTLEHVEDERRSLNELWRVLRPGGAMIITTPHRGLFSWLDHANYLPALRSLLARRLPRLFAAVQRARGKAVMPRSDYDWVPHRHYTVSGFHQLFNSTQMAGEYRIDRVFRSGLLLFPIALTLSSLGPLLPAAIARPLLGVAGRLSEREYWIPFGAAAYNIGVRVIKDQARSQNGSR